MTPEDNKALVRRLFEDAFNMGDLAALDDVVASDVIDHNPMPGQAAGIEGIRYVVTALRTAHSDLQFTLGDLFAAGDRVAVRWTLRGTNTAPFLGVPPSDQAHEERAIVIFRVADGKLTERWAAFER